MKKALILVLALFIGMLSGCKKTINPGPDERINDTIRTDTTVAGAKADTTTADTAAHQKDTYTSIKKVMRLRSKEIDESMGGYLFSENNVNLAWPTHLAGCNNIAPLHKALLKEAFNYTKDLNVNAGVQKYLSSPVYADNGFDDACVPAKKDEMNEECMSCNQSKSLYLYLKMDSPTLMAFSIYNYDYTGGAHGMYVERYVVFDRTGSQVMNTRTFTNLKSKALLNVLNRQIQTEARKNKTQYSNAVAIHSFYPTAKGMAFVFQPYEIASYAEGMITVIVPYQKLEAFFTPEFKEMVKAAATFKTLKSPVGEM